jgi:sugar phosphate isomerase/epimerase
MAISTLPLAYCANVHPAETWDQACSNIRTFAASVRARMGRPVGLGVWLPARLCAEATDERVERLRETIAEADVAVYTMNAFPFGDFHAERVKEEAYRPDWTSLERLNYTAAAAELLARLAPEGCEASLSTLPLAFAPHHPIEKDTSIYRPLLVEIARRLQRLRDATGRLVRLAVEPEPGCVLETTQQAVDFFQSLWRATDGGPDELAVREHVGLCYDVCHQAVEYEQVGESIAQLHSAGVRIHKIQLSCALELREPADDAARMELSTFAEKRYLHQTFAKHPGGRILKLLDLTADHARRPSADWLDCESWRVHFHVPVHREAMGRLATTRPSLAEALAAAARLDDAPHLEVETYTWGVLSSRDQADVEFDLVEGLVNELSSARALIEAALAGGAAH